MLLVLSVFVNVAISAPRPNPADLTADDLSGLNDINAEDVEDSLIGGLGGLSRNLLRLGPKLSKSKLPEPSDSDLDGLDPSLTDQDPAPATTTTATANSRRSDDDED